MHASLMRTIEGRSYRLLSPKNAFKYPDAEGAVFSQHKVMKPIDFRSSHLPMAGYATKGNRRKYEGEQKEYMDNLAKNSHPKQELMAGGGAILAKTGLRISQREAELIATRATHPEIAAIAELPPAPPVRASNGLLIAPARASSAVAAAVAEEAEDAMDVPDPGNAELPGRADSDHLRRPVVKDTTVARNRERPNSVKKKTKPVVKSAAKAKSPAKTK